jgi:hypothetical protein
MFIGRAMDTQLSVGVFGCDASNALSSRELPTCVDTPRMRVVHPPVTCLAFHARSFTARSPCEVLSLPHCAVRGSLNADEKEAGLASFEHQLKTWQLGNILQASTQAG